MSSSSSTPSQPPSPFDTPSRPSPPSGRPDRPSPNPGFGSIFQSPGGPPLILVCIAAGLLLGAFIGVLLMRRMRPPVVVQRMGAGRGRGAVKLGEKPKLLDIHLGQRTDVGSSGSHIQDAQGKAAGAARWAYVFVSLLLRATVCIRTSPSPFSPLCVARTGRVRHARTHITTDLVVCYPNSKLTTFLSLPLSIITPAQPFAAIYLPSSSKTSSSGGSPSQPSPSNANANANLNPVSRLLTRLRHRDRRAHDRAAHASSAGPSPSSPARLVQFAVTVSMPDPRQPTYMRPGSRAAKEKEKEAGLRDDNPTSNEPYAHDRHAPNADHGKEEELSMPDCCIGTFIVQYTPPTDTAPATQADTRIVTTSTSTPTLPTPPLTMTGRAASSTTAVVMLPPAVQSAQTRHLPFTISR
ncbi:hypothetical protein C8Q74DRAFT_784229 [Fomes fomentarius]|nr:hypothetical protein C8Q74DRAFT_784229 [Fomes fomentarius]